MNVTDLLASVNDRGALPPLQQTWTNAKIVNAMNEEMLTFVVAATMSAQQDFFNDSQDTALVGSTAIYNMPTRAMGSDLRAMLWVDSSGNVQAPIARMTPAQIGAFFTLTSDRPLGFYFLAETIALVPTPSASPTGTLRMFYFRRPGTLVQSTATGIIVSMSTNGLNPGPTVTAVTNPSGTTARYAISDTTNLTTGTASITISGCTNAGNNGTFTTITAVSSNAYVEVTNAAVVAEASPPAAANAFWGTWKLSGSAPANLTTSTTADLTGCIAPYKLKMKDVIPNYATSTYVGVPPGSAPSDSVVGDFVTSAMQSYVPHLPEEVHKLIALRTVGRILKAMGDLEGGGQADADAERMRKDVLDIIAPRSPGNPQKIRRRF